MRILFFTAAAYLPQSIGGSKLATHELALELIRQGNKVAVLAGLQKGGSIFWFNRLKAKTLDRGQVPCDRGLGYPVYRSWVPASGVSQVLRQVIGEFKPDTVVFEAGFGQRMDLVPQCSHNGVRTALYFHDVEFERMQGLDTMDDRTVLIANSTYTATRLHERFGRKAVVVPPLVTPERYITTINPTYVLHVNPHPMKGIETTLDLARARPDLPFHVQESWTLSDDVVGGYRRQAQGLSNVEWAEPVSDMKSVWSRTRVLLVPSRWIETWGRVVTEAQLNGIPVISSDSGGLPESVGDGGVVIPRSAPIDEWNRVLGLVWEEGEYRTSLVAKALKHASRNEAQPEVIARRFVLGLVGNS